MKRSDNTSYKTFDQEYLTELCDSINVVEFVNEYVPLTKAGSNYKAKCPFHLENTASFVVSPTKGLYHCFSCKKGGNVIRFLMDREGMTFYEAVIFLSERAGLTPPHTTNTEEYEKFKKTQESLLKSNTIAVELWSKNLESSKVATDYLTDRGITKDTIDTFKIGFASTEWTQLTDELNNQKIDASILQESGLVSESKGKTFDRFRNRVITPVSDLHGKVIGFSGRTLSTDKKEAKYVNSPDTPIYNKGKHLFGLNITKDAIRRRGFAILTEGNFDIISLYQNGVDNVVAGLGTALTAQQAKLLKRFTDKVVICYDADPAGELATERAIKTLQAEGFIIKVMELPEGSDPDDYIRTKGKTQFNTLRGQSVSWFRYLLHKSIAKHDLSNPTDKVKLLERVQELVGFATTELEKREYFSQGMEILKIDKDIAKKSWSKISTEPVPVAVEKENATLTESKFLQLLLYADDRKTPIEEVKKYLRTPEVRKLALILATLRGEFRYTLVESLLGDEDKAFLRQLSINADEYVPQLESLETEIKHCITAIKRDALQFQLEEVGELVSAHLKTTSDNWESELNDLFTRGTVIAKELRALR